MKTYLNKIFTTKGSDGKPNGRIIRVWERGEVTLGYGPGQVYITTILPGCTKGPHLHMHRDSLFCCVRGTVRITTRRQVGERALIAPEAKDNTNLVELTRLRTYEYSMVTSGGLPSTQPVAVYVPAGTPCALYNAGHDEALVVNVSSEPYDASDEHEVLDWRPE